MRRIIANLFAEADLAALESPRRRRTSPPQSVLKKIAPMASWLRVFAREGDHLWIPALVEELPEALGLPEVVLESGPLKDLPPARDVLAWCETPEVAEHRAHPRSISRQVMGKPLEAVLWQLPLPSPAVVAKVHHRAFCLEMAEKLRCALPGAAMVESLSDLDRAAARVPRWVVKAPLSAAGRDRYIERNGPGLTNPKARRTVERLFERHGALLFEPWMDRVDDYGVAALVTPSSSGIIGIHRQEVDRKGQFAGISLSTGLSYEERFRLEGITYAVGDALQAAGYCGPFGIDAWQYQREDGSIAFHPLGEINARMTFGLVAWALTERLAEQGEPLHALLPAGIE